MRFEYEDLKTLEMPLPEEIQKLKMAGDLKAAEAAILRYLELPLAEEMKKRLRLEQHYLKLLPQEYPYTCEQVLALFAPIDPSFDRETLQGFEEQRLADWMFIDGEKHYIHSIYRNLTNKVPYLRKLAGIEEADQAETTHLKAEIEEMKAKGYGAKRFRLRSTLRLKDELFEPGMKVRVHLPVPSTLYQTRDVEILELKGGNPQVDPENALYRAVCFEEEMQENHEFAVEYEYSIVAPYHDFGMEDMRRAARSFRPDPSAAGQLKEEGPHIVFTPYLRALAKEIVGREMDALEIARKIYDYITKNVKYSYQREYTLFTGIAEYCALNLRGDCGVQALLFITLCRICGVPARWQSGLFTLPEGLGAHDWAMFYAEPYGWLYADPSLGGAAYAEGDEERRRFYFGNLDPYRMTANHAFSQSFRVPKQYFPADTCDNQLGEMECETRGFGGSDLIRMKELIWEKPL